MEELEEHTDPLTTPLDRGLLWFYLISTVALIAALLVGVIFDINFV